MSKKLREVKVGYAVTVDGRPTGLAMTKAGADIVRENRSSLKGTRLYYDTKVTVFPNRRKARRAIKRTKRAVEKSGGLWLYAEYEITTLVVLK